MNFDPDVLHLFTSPLELAQLWFVMVIGCLAFIVARRIAGRTQSGVVSRLAVVILRTVSALSLAVVILWMVHQ